MKRRTDETGLAAVELALLLTVLFALVALVAPLAYLFYERVQLGRTTGDVVRFATSRSTKTRITQANISGVLTTYRVERNNLPSSVADDTEAVGAYTGLGSSVLTANVRASDSNCPSGFRRTITLSTTVKVGAFTGFLIGGSDKTLLATASSCEE